MPKYRRLSTLELSELEKEFVDFLVLNGIVADDWEKIKKNSARANKMIDSFSNVVFESMLRKTMFLEWRSKNEIRTFQCLEKEIVLVGIKADRNIGADFTDPAFIDIATTNPPKGIHIYTTTKLFKEEREKEMFELIQNGAEITDGTLFKALALAL